MIILYFKAGIPWFDYTCVLNGQANVHDLPKYASGEALGVVSGVALLQVYQVANAALDAKSCNIFDSCIIDSWSSQWASHPIIIFLKFKLLVFTRQRLQKSGEIPISHFRNISLL